MATKSLHAVQFDEMTFGMDVDTSTQAWKRFKASVKYEPCISIFGTEVSFLTVPYLNLAAIMEGSHWLVSERKNFLKFMIEDFMDDQWIYVKYGDGMLDFRTKRYQ